MSVSVAMAAETEPQPARPQSRRRPGGGAAGPDRLTVLLLSLAGFFVMLTLLASQLRSTGVVSSTRPVVVLRRIYETTVIEKVPPNIHASGGVSSATQSVSGSVSAAPTTRTS